MNQLDITNLHIAIEDKEILKGVNLSMKSGEIHALMGPNGSGKSTLSLSIMGHLNYRVMQGDIVFEGERINDMPVFERARKKIFLAFQYPSAVTGVSVSNFIRSAYLAQNPGANFQEFMQRLQTNMELLKLDKTFTQRYLNDGFSGGEKKKAEILQLAVLQPKLAMLDETDSGLDIDALRIVSEGVNAIKAKDMSILIVTHYQRILNYIKPDVVHVMYEGRIIKSGGSELAAYLEKEGYEKIIKEYTDYAG